LQIRLCLQVLAPQPVASKSVRVILNCKSGPGHAEADVEKVRQAFADTALGAEITLLEHGKDPRAVAREALKEGPPVLVAAGGDGTISALADVVRGTGTALGILPMGTMNHFARDLGIPLDLAQAARVIAAGRRVSVDVGEVNGNSFVNNASLGIYPKIVRERVAKQRRFGHSKRAAMVWATLAVLDRLSLVALRLELEGRVHECRAPFVFVGNNNYALEGFQIGTRERLDAGKLNVYTTRCSTAGGLVGLALRAMIGQLRQADDFMEGAVRSLRVESPHRKLLVAIDGEVKLMETPLEFKIRPRSLQVVVP
jgi:diacylglycerol kinase family enzyme